MTEAALFAELLSCIEATKRDIETMRAELDKLNRMIGSTSGSKSGRDVIPAETKTTPQN